MNETAKKRAPLYKAIYDDILTKVQSGEYKPGDKIPTEAEWAEQYNVSRITSKKALDMAAENLIIRKMPGKGSYITEDAKKICKRVGKKQNPLLAVIQPDLSDFFGLKNFLNLEKLAHQEGYLLLTGISNKDIEKEKELIAKYYDYGVDGFIIFPVHNETFNNEILKLIIDGFPVILIDRYLRDVSCPNVVTNNQDAAYKGMSYLYSLNHKCIGVVSRPIGTTSTLQERERGIKNAIMEQQYPFKPQWWLTDLKDLDDKSDESYRSHKEMIRSFLQDNRELTAIITLEYSAIPIIEKVADEMGLRIPEDLSLISFDSPGHLVNHLKPVTHLQQNEEAIARKAFALMKDMLNGEKLSRYKYQIDADLVVGETTAAP